MNKPIVKRIFTTAAALHLAITIIKPAASCTRAVYLGPSNMVVTGRNMDWMEDIKTNLWVFPRGMKRDGAAGVNSLQWESKYGSLAASGYDVGTADGINEAGLAANLLYLAEADYGKRADNRPGLSIGAWAQYVLDNYATVGDAVDNLSKDEFQIVAPLMPNGSAAVLHLALSDPTGDSAIFEYIAGKLVVHRGKQYQVMTNSPTFDKQLALNAYWQTIGGFVMLPGTNRAADRFVRASFYINKITQTDDPKQAVAAVFSVMHNASTPLGISTPTQPNISSTIWTSVSDQKDKVYYFGSCTSPNVFWVPLKDLDFTAGAPVKKLPLTDGQVYSGAAANKFVVAQPFNFLSATSK